MTTTLSGERTSQAPVRLWPGVVAVSLQWLAWLALPAIAPDQAGTAILVAAAMGVVTVAWWLFFSHAPWIDRLGAIVVMVGAVYATSFLVHPSISNGMMGLMLFIYSIPAQSLALAAGLVASRGLSVPLRRVSVVAAIVVACVSMTIIRTNGISGDSDSDLAWRWTPTAEERLLAQASAEPTSLAPAPAAAATAAPTAAAAPEVPPVPATSEPKVAGSGLAMSEARSSRVDGSTALTMSEPEFTRVEWPGFRGPGRDSVVHGARIETAWAQSPPVEMWRRPIGPGWSSFAVAGDRVFTQEQRGDDEMVTAYDLQTGKPVWAHRDAARFWESNGGAGPRGTPTLSHGRVYTLGATGLLNALDARTGAVIWSRNATGDTGRKIPDWGISSSPLVVGDVVIVATAGTLAAYDAATGTPRWMGPKGGSGYSSPQLATIGGIEQVVLVNGPGAIGVDPSDGTVLWTHTWEGDSIVQPAVIPGGDLLIGSGSGLAANNGLLRVSVAHEPGGWTLSERWMSRGLKPYFNDFVVHKGHAFGFDGSILACVDLADGTRAWKGGRYGHGQFVLLPDQDLLLVLSEDGELALVSATPDKFTEVARVPAINGKTWNHPVLVGDTLLVRNGEEMAAFRLSVEKAGR